MYQTTASTMNIIRSTIMIMSMAINVLLLTTFFVGEALNEVRVLILISVFLMDAFFLCFIHAVSYKILKRCSDEPQYF